MKKSLQIITRLFEVLARLFPKEFRNEFEEELPVVFSAMVREGAKEGRAKLMIVCFRELLDFPIALFRAYLENDRMRKFYGSPPVKSALREAVGYGLFFTIVSLASIPVFPYLFDQQRWVLKSLFEDTPLLIQDIFTLFFELIGFSFVALFGSLFISIFINGRSRFRQYILPAMLAWMIPQMVLQTFSTQVNILYVDTPHTIFFEIIPGILMGAFMGVLYIVSRNARQGTIRYLAIGMVLYPILTFIFSRLINSFVPLNSLFSMMVVFLLFAVLLSGVLYAANRIERRVPWVVIGGAIIYPLLNGLYLLLFFWFHLFPDLSSNPFLNYMIFNAFLGVFVGVSIGLIAGSQKESAITP